VDRRMYYLSFELIRVEIRCREAENGTSRWGQQIYGGRVAQTVASGRRSVGAYYSSNRNPQQLIKNFDPQLALL